MKNIILIICVIAVLVYGYFLMVKLDKFLAQNLKAQKNKNDEHTKPYIILKEDTNIVKTQVDIKKICCNYSDTGAVICNTTESDYDDLEQFRKA